MGIFLPPSHTSKCVKCIRMDNVGIYFQVAQGPTTELESRLAEERREHEALKATHASAMETIRLSEAEMVDKSERLETASVQV